MTGPVFDLAARRAAKRRDAGSAIHDLREGAASLLATFSSWPRMYLREHHLIAAERELVAMQSLLVELRGHVAGGPDDAA